LEFMEFPFRVTSALRVEDEHTGLRYQPVLQADMAGFASPP
jgi:hypothetical protein